MKRVCIILLHVGDHLSKSGLLLFGIIHAFFRFYKKTVVFNGFNHLLIGFRREQYAGGGVVAISCNISKFVKMFIDSFQPR